VKVGDLVVYNPASVGGMTGEIVRCEDFGLGIILDENPHYYFINWSNICTDSPSLATIKDHVVQATIKNVQRLREHNERKKNT
tara:strand:- start:526 stop:774 length:249 start_codon:yes stop_codon:yes gene_type:complete